MFVGTLRAFAVVVCALSLSTSAYAQDRVGLASNPFAGCQFTSIEDAIAAAATIDTVYALPDTYTGEDWGVMSKIITVVPAPVGSNCTSPDPTQTLNIEADGASLVDVTGTLFLKHSVVTEGSDSQILVTSGTLNLVDTTLQGSTTSCKLAVEGGLLHVSEGGQATIDGPSYLRDSCTGAAGGAAYVTGLGSLLIVEGKVLDNFSGTAGGGIAVMSSASAKIQVGALVGSNESAGDGGGVFVGPFASLETSSSGAGVAFVGNTAAAHGGAVHVAGSADIQKALFLSNQADEGGAISYIEPSFGLASLFVTDSDLILNTASGSGGGLHVVGDPLPFPVPRVTRTDIDDNTARSGGGVEVVGTTLAITDSHIDGNDAELTGGGLLAIESVVNVSDTIITGNSAHLTGPLIPGGVGGGGVACNAGAEVNLTNATVDDNETGRVQGGGLLAVNCEVTADNTSFDGNTSAVRGGGVALDTSSAVVEITNGSTIEGNQANRGGGISVTGGGTIDVIDSTVNLNNATVAGGGAYLDDQSTAANPTLQSANAGWGGLAPNDNDPEDIWIEGSPLNPFDFSGASTFTCSAATNTCL
ncbi:MAG: hypothetical protein KTR31_16375 [Myxococcales bacterium]|nr:hypothetical protein [Myxococcales bacterium]